MKEPEVLQTIVIYHCLCREIVFEVIQKKLKIDQTYIHNGGKIR